MPVGKKYREISFEFLHNQQIGIVTGKEINMDEEMLEAIEEKVSSMHRKMEKEESGILFS